MTSDTSSTGTRYYYFYTKQPVLSYRSAWEVLDYGDVVVHVLTPEQRDFYDLESFYGAAEEIDLPFLREEPKFGGNWAKAQPS